MGMGFSYGAILVIELVRFTKVKNNLISILQTIQINT